MKKYYILIIIIIVILIGTMGWFTMFKKSWEGEHCKIEENCSKGMICIGGVCSKGNENSPCLKDEDCKSGICLKNKCSQGGEGSYCESYKDCQKDFLCKELACQKKPAVPFYAKYFDKIELQKMKNGVAPGPNNIPVASKEFKIGDGMNIDMQLKENIEGKVYFDMVDSVSGERIFFHPDFEAKGAIGRGFPAPPKPGNYDLNIYFDDELMDTIDFKVSEK